MLPQFFYAFSLSQLLLYPCHSVTWWCVSYHLLQDSNKHLTGILQSFPKQCSEIYNYGINYMIVRIVINCNITYYFSLHHLWREKNDILWSAKLSTQLLRPAHTNHDGDPHQSRCLPVTIIIFSVFFHIHLLSTHMQFMVWFVCRFHQTWALYTSLITLYAVPKWQREKKKRKKKQQQQQLFLVHSTHLWPDSWWNMCS